MYTAQINKVTPALGNASFSWYEAIDTNVCQFWKEHFLWLQFEQPIFITIYYLKSITQKDHWCKFLQPTIHCIHCVKCILSPVEMYEGKISQFLHPFYTSFFHLVEFFEDGLFCGGQHQVSHIQNLNLMKINTNKYIIVIRMIRRK